MLAFFQSFPVTGFLFFFVTLLVKSAEYNRNQKVSPFSTKSTFKTSDDIK